ncbi:hypothetical protein [Kitasatospora acidiphila]|uniref:hypothetical protein n=1 Tax=Kitasatospora acidiphila TaxID=2567942 RepID=UPI0015F05030|nr:hypothetical protein [Kitasatospora acidiphila]
MAGAGFVCSAAAYSDDHGTTHLGYFETADAYQAVTWAQTRVGQLAEQLHPWTAPSAITWMASVEEGRAAMASLMLGQPLQVEVANAARTQYVVVVSRAHNEQPSRWLS